VLTGDLCRFLTSLLQSPAQYFTAAGALIFLHPSKDPEDVQRDLLEFSGYWPLPTRLLQSQPPEGRGDEGERSFNLRFSTWSVLYLMSEYNRFFMWINVPSTDSKSIYKESCLLCFYVSGHNIKSSGPWQVLKLGKYSLKWTTTHDILQLVIIYLTKTRPKWRSHVWQTKYPLTASIGGSVSGANQIHLIKGIVHFEINFWYVW